MISWDDFEKINIIKLGTLYAKSLPYLISRLKPRGFVLATGLHPPVLETASHVSKCLRLRLAPNRANVPYARTVVKSE